MGWITVLSDKQITALFVSLARMERMMAQVLKIEEEMIMPTLDEVLADVQEESSQIEGLIAYTKGLKQQVDDALAGKLSAADQAKVDAIFDAVEAGKAKVMGAINAGTPASNIDPNAEGPPA